jgi:thiamine transport system substrate-binding protein
VRRSRTISARFRVAAAVAVLAIVSAACTTGADDGSDGSPGARSITLVTHDSFDVSQSVLRAFERSSGIHVDVVQAGDAGQLVNRAILTAGHPEGDVLFGIDDNLLATGLDHDLFVPYASPRLSEVDDAYQLDPEHRVTPIDHGEVCINDDLGWFADHGLDPPATLDDLADPAYRGLLTVENPATSTPGLAFLLATIARFGDGWQDYWRRLRDNDVLVVDGWERAYYGEFSGAGGGSGTRPLVVSYASSPPAEVVFAEEPLDHAPTGVLEDTCYRQIEFAGILAGTEHEAEARELIDFMLSTRFQDDIPLRMFVFPVVRDATLPAVFRKYAVVPPNPLHLPPDEVATNRTGWIDRWTDVVLR